MSSEFERVTDSQFCRCPIPGMINDGIGIDPICHYCGKPVEVVKTINQKQEDEYNNSRSRNDRQGED